MTTVAHTADAVAIDTPARSVFDTSPDKLRPFLQGLAGRVAGGTNWMVRKKTIFDLLLGLDAFFALPAAERRSLMADGGAPEEEPGPAEAGGDGPEDFRRVLPLYVGAILEGLAEAEMVSAEQAAVYLLSIHPEHQAAAERWMLADPRHGKAVRRLMRTDRRYRQLMDRMADHWRAGRRRLGGRNG